MVGAFKSVWLLQIVWQHQRSWHQHEGEGGDGRQQGGVEARSFWLKWYIMMLPTSMISSFWLSLPSTVSSTTNTYDLNIVRLVERITIFQVNQHYYSVSHPSWRKFQPKWYILMSTTSLDFSSNLFMPSTVLLTNQMGETNQVCLGLSGLRRKPTKDNLAESRSFIIHIVCIVCWVKTSRLGLFLQVVVPSHHIHHKRSQLMLSSAWQPFYLTKHCKRHNRSKGCVLSPK